MFRLSFERSTVDREVVLLAGVIRLATTRLPIKPRMLQVVLCIFVLRICSMLKNCMLSFGRFAQEGGVLPRQPREVLYQHVV